MIIIWTLINMASSLNLACINNLVQYWGQNSYGSSHLKHTKRYEKPLRHYCDTTSSDVIVLSFLTKFNIGGLPELNFSNHCENKDGSPSCPQIAQDVLYCQTKNKQIFLSLGGARSQAGFKSLQEAQIFAKTVWDMFLGGSSANRPFGAAVLDGIDLDIESGGAQFYDTFVTILKEYYNQHTSKKYYISAAPQCTYPDANLQTALDKSWFDMIFVQFYNNYCGLQNYNKGQFNYAAWDTWARTISLNKKVKLFLGAPSSATSAASGYVQPLKLNQIISELKNYPSFGGIMFWDISGSENNVINGLKYDQLARNYLKANNKCTK